MVYFHCDWLQLHLYVRFKAAKRPAEVPPTDLELTHYWQRVHRREKTEKNGKNFGLWNQPKNHMRFEKKCNIAIKPHAVF